MKKLAILCLTIVLTLALGVCGITAAEGEDPAGLWKLAEMSQGDETMGKEEIAQMEATGVVIYMELTADGQAMLSYAGTETEGTYDDQNITFEDEPAGYTMEDGYLVIAEGTVVMKFERTTQEGLNAIQGREEGVLDGTAGYPSGEVKILDVPEGSVTITGYEADDAGFSVLVHCENTADKKLLFAMSKSILNRYQIEPMWGISLEAGESKDSKVNFKTADLKKAGISSVDELITEMRVVDSEAYEVLEDDVITTVYPTGKTAEDIVPADRMTSENETVFADDENCLFVVLGDEVDPILGYKVNCYFENRLEKDLTAMWQSATLNGKESTVFFAEEVPAGTRGYFDAVFPNSVLEGNGIESVSEVGFNLIVIDEKGFMNPVLETQCLYTP